VATTSLVAENNTQQRWHEKKNYEDKTELEIESSNGAHCEPWERRRVFTGSKHECGWRAGRKAPHDPTANLHDWRDY